jgi:hypothetical protein
MNTRNTNEHKNTAGSVEKSTAAASVKTAEVDKWKTSSEKGETAKRSAFGTAKAL